MTPIDSKSSNSKSSDDLAFEERSFEAGSTDEAHEQSIGSESRIDMASSSGKGDTSESLEQTTAALVSKKMREDIKEIQLQLAGLEFDEQVFAPGYIPPENSELPLDLNADSHLELASGLSEPFSEPFSQPFGGLLSEENSEEKLTDSVQVSSDLLPEEFQVEFAEEFSQPTIQPVGVESSVPMRLSQEVGPRAELPDDLDFVGELTNDNIETEVAGNDMSTAATLSESIDIKALIAASPSLMHALNSIPATLAFKIGEAADLVGVKQYVLRYWETEFDQLKPKKSKNGQRVYSRRDVENAMMIKKLLYDDRFSIEGARAALKQLKHGVKEEKAVQELVSRNDQIKGVALLQMRNMLENIRSARETLVSSRRTQQ
jgi:DNA-binding transcriptional MerR regulator